MKYIKAATVY